MLSIIVPSYNEEDNIGKTVRDLKELDLDESYEVIVVDDGSDDRTAGNAEEAGADQVLSYDPNRGKGYAMRKGVESSQGEKILFMDADQHEVIKIPKFIERLEKGKVIIGNRNPDRMPWTRRINNFFANLAIILATGRTMKDPVCGMRAIYKEDLLELDLAKDGFEVESEINIKSLDTGMDVGFVPVNIDYPPQPFRFNTLGFKKSFKLASYLSKSVIISWLDSLGILTDDKFSN